MIFEVIGGASGDPFQLLFKTVGSNSLGQMVASALRFSNVIGGQIVDVMKLIGGSVYITGKLLLGAAGQIELDPSFPLIMWKIGAARLVIGQMPNDGLIYWFGPSMAVSAMTKANATDWRDSSGNAFYGGSIIAGRLSNSQQGTDTTVGAQTVLGPFATNGNPIAVVWSYAFNIRTRRTSDSPLPANPTAVIRLYRQIGTAAETLVGTMSLTGTVVTNQNGANDFFINNAISGSSTFTDTAGGTVDRTYRVVVEARTVGTQPGSSVAAAVTNQRYSIVTSEQ